MTAAQRSGGQAGSDTLDVYALTEAWQEGALDGTTCSTAGVIWTSRDCVAANNWTTAGGTTDGTVYASATLPSNFIGAVNWGVTTLAQAWVGGSPANRGLLVRRSGESAGAKPRHDFDSREGTTVPQLTVVYTPPTPTRTATATGTATFTASNAAQFQRWAAPALPGNSTADSLPRLEGRASARPVLSAVEGPAPRKRRPCTLSELSGKAGCTLRSLSGRADSCADRGRQPRGRACRHRDPRTSAEGAWTGRDGPGVHALGGLRATGFLVMGTGRRPRTAATARRRASGAWSAADRQPPPGPLPAGVATW